MLLAIVHNNPSAFADRWIEYCKEKKISFRIVDPFASDIMEQTQDCDAFLWNWHHNDPSARLFARQLLASMEAVGKRVFPSTRTGWHFDDKVGQKYLLEAIGAPLAPAHVFYDKKKALQWIEIADFPKVFKLRGGAGSLNVRLVKNQREAIRLCRQAFGRGFNPVAGYLTDFSSRIRKTRKTGNWIEKLQRAPGNIMKILKVNAAIGRESGYVYFQDFMAGNTCDTRITVIGNRAFGGRRGTRPGDFRASGSGISMHDHQQIDLRCVTIAFDVAEKLKTQSLAFDFILDASGQPVIVEICYCYMPSYIHSCEGFWDRDLRFHPGNFWPEDFILDDLIDELQGPEGSFD